MRNSKAFIVEANKCLKSISTGEMNTIKDTKMC